MTMYNHNSGDPNRPAHQPADPPDESYSPKPPASGGASKPYDQPARQPSDPPTPTGSYPPPKQGTYPPPKQDTYPPPEDTCPPPEDTCPPPEDTCPPPEDTCSPEPKPDECPPTTTKPPQGQNCEPPELDKPSDFKPPKGCKCPSDAGEGPSPTQCLEDLIRVQAAKESEGKAATDSKQLLEDQMKKALAASQGYTQAKYDELLARWKTQDADIAKLADMLACSVKCWRCVLECHVGPLIHEVAVAETQLYGDGGIPGDVHTLYDVQYWHSRNVARLDRRLTRVRNVLDAWTNDPAGTIDKALTANKDMHDKIKQNLGKEPGKVLYDAFLKLIPKHLAIGPSCKTSPTKIRQCYTQFSFGNEECRDETCGPNVGERSLRDRLIEPPFLPNLVAPAKYMEVVCCLVKDHYAPAQAAWSAATAELAAVDKTIEAHKKRLTDWVKAVKDAADRTIPAVVDCGAYIDKPADAQQKPANTY